MTLPRVQPIAPTWHKEPFDDPDWLFDFKYDGFRALCYLEQRRNRLISRNNNIMTRFDALADQVAAALNIDDAILDGEIIAADETGRPVFIDLLRSTHSPCYIAFDLLWLNGIDLQPLPLYERRQALQTILPKGSPTVSEPLSIIAPHFPSLDACARPRARGCRKSKAVAGRQGRALADRSADSI